MVGGSGGSIGWSVVVEMIVGGGDIGWMVSVDKKQCTRVD